MNKTELAQFLNPRYLSLFILPTEQCNFRCTYCYEDFEIGQMKDNTVQAVKKLMDRRLPALQQFILSWFGGEPLMAKQVVYELSAHAQRVCAQAGVHYSGSMTTNAFGMDRATFDRLVELGVNDYQVSIDGDEDEHNKTRKLMSGRGTFHKIWENLLAMRDHPGRFKVLLRLHIHRENIDSMQALMPKLHEAFGADPRFVIFMKAVGNWGGDSVRQMALLKNGDQVIEELRAQLETLGWFAARPVRKSSAPAMVSPCYAAKPNSFVIRADGTLAKCTVAFNDKRNSVGHINDDGTLEILGDKVKPFMRGFQNMDEEELHCPMRGMPSAEEVKVMIFQKPESIAAVA